MNQLMYMAGMMGQASKVLVRRMLGQQTLPSWKLSTELVWATTRYTMLSSHRHGLPWLKQLSASFTPKTKSKQVRLTEMNRPWGNYLEIQPNSLNDPSAPIMIYFHGGGYVIGSPQASGPFLAELAAATQMLVLAPTYPTAPEEVYPAAHRAALSLTHHLINAYPDRPVYLAGDSAGAALALSIMMQLSHDSAVNIRGGILISPWTDPASETGSIQTNADIDIGDPAYLKACYDTYLAGKREDPSDPLTFREEALPPLPPILLTVGTAEMLLDQTTELKEALTRTGTQAELITYPDMFHTFWNLPGTIPEADRLIQEIAAWRLGQA
ncbi:MAG: alpha/beta hydrolase [Bacteroidota bacterium]